jgi:hypothetical protein
VRHPWIVPEPPPADDVASGRGPAAALAMEGAAAAALPMASGCAAHCTRQGVQILDPLAARHPVLGIHRLPRCQKDGASVTDADVAHASAVTS